MNQCREFRFGKKLYQLNQRREVGPVDQCVIRLEGICAIGDAVEQGGWQDAGDHVARCREVIDVDLEDVPTVDRLQAPRGKLSDDPEYIGSVLQQKTQKVCADESTGTQHYDRSAQCANVIRNFCH